ncbi:hypothetical protein F4818DRAFT_50023 [Hypoxylon cercidicola]|nr:hypothetical protein F4818DRAFT_50023 [Hypoxylon cercidicola]
MKHCLLSFCPHIFLFSSQFCHSFLHPVTSIPCLGESRSIACACIGVLHFPIRYLTHNSSRIASSVNYPLVILLGAESLSSWRCFYT